MNEENILLNIEFNNDDVKNAVKNITEGRKQIDALIEANKKLVAQGEKNTAAYVQNEVAIKALNSEVNNNSKLVQANTQAVTQNADSIEALKKRNSELLKERNKLSTSNEEDVKRIKELNDEYDANSKIIADNSTKVEKQRFNIGNYSSALSGISPQLGAFSQNLGTASKESGGLTSGLFSMVKASLAFIATPLGAIIAAIVLAFKALQTYLTGSEEGMDMLAKATAQLSAVFAVLKNTIVQIGGALAAFAKGDFSEGVDKLTDSFSNLDDRIRDAVKSAGELADIMDTLDELRLQAQVRNGEEANQIKNLILQSKNRLLTEKQRSDLLAKASEIEKKITGEKLALQLASINASTRQFLVDTDRQDLAQKEGETTLEFTKRIIADQTLLFDKRQELADQLGEYNSLLDNQANIQEEIQNQQDALAEKAAADAQKKADAEKKRLEDEAAAQKKARDEEFENRQEANELLKQQEQETAEFQKGLQDQALADFAEYTQGLINEKKRELLEGKISQEEFNQEMSDLELATLETQQMIKRQFGDEDLKLQEQITDYKIALGQKEVDIKKQQEQAKIDAVQNGLGVIASAFNRQSVAFKVLASVQTLITTYQSAIAAFNSLANIPYVGTILGIAAAAAATANGLQAVARINSTQVPRMAEGGAMEIRGKSHAQGGEDVYIGNRKVANVEGGENMVILKRGSTPLLRNLANVNRMLGGVDFYSDRAPKRYLADGGFVARSAASRVQSEFQIQGFAEEIAKLKIYTAITDIQKAETNQNRANVISELS